MKAEIRKETPSDWFDAEYVTKKAFWNLHVPGCDEHYLVHKLRDDKAYIPELTRIAAVDGRVVGAIYYSRAFVRSDEKSTEVLTFGPLCVDPEFQKQGIGGELLEHTMQLAKEMGFKGIVIYGEPDYYPRHGFVTCDKFGITTPDGKNFSAFMAKELVEGGFSEISGKFYESETFENLPPDEVEEYDKKFPYMEKRVLPGQWNQ